MTPPRSPPGSGFPCRAASADAPGSLRGPLPPRGWLSVLGRFCRRPPAGAPPRGSGFPSRVVFADAPGCGFPSRAVSATGPCEGHSLGHCFPSRVVWRPGGAMRGPLPRVWRSVSGRFCWQPGALRGPPRGGELPETVPYPFWLKSRGGASQDVRLHQRSTDRCSQISSSCHRCPPNRDGRQGSSGRRLGSSSGRMAGAGALATRPRNGPAGCASPKTRRRSPAPPAASSAHGATWRRARTRATRTLRPLLPTRLLGGLRRSQVQPRPLPLASQRGTI